MSAFLNRILFSLALISLCKANSLLGDVICGLLDVSGDLTVECKDQIIRACNHSEIMWKMFDASSKFPITGDGTGLFYSNNKDLGNYDECMSIELNDFYGKIKGKYCGYSLEAQLPYPGIANPFPDFIEGAATAPATTRLLMSLCIPDACTTREAVKILKFQNITVLPEEQTLRCVTKETDRTLEWFDIAFICFLVWITSLIVLSTTYDRLCRNLGKEPHYPVLVAFSLITNHEKLFSIKTQQNKEIIECFNGFRFISVLWIICGHNYAVQTFLPLQNYAEISDWMNSLRIQYINAGFIAYDTFFFISGFLMAYQYLKFATIRKSNLIIGIPKLLIRRYLRLTVPLAVLYLTQITIFRLLGTGPMWHKTVSEQRQICIERWWPFFLYIQNYYDWKNMCLPWTWYISAEMQLFVLIPTVLIPLVLLPKIKRRPILALAWLVFLVLMSIVIPIAHKFMDETYMNNSDSHSRAVDVLIGIFAGTVFKLYLKDKPFKFSRLVNVIIWLVVLGVGLVIVLYHHEIAVNYSRNSNILFMGLYKPIWCFSLAWMTYSCYHGFGGLISDFLCLPVFQIGARLSYSMYILHYLVIICWAAQYRTDWYWGDYNAFYAWCGHFIVTLVISVVWGLAFEMPIAAILKVFIQV